MSGRKGVCLGFTCIVTAKYFRQQTVHAVLAASYLRRRGSYREPTKADVWERCCKRRGFSLSSSRFSTFLSPRWSLGGRVLNALRDAAGGEGSDVVETEAALSDS